MTATSISPAIGAIEVPMDQWTRPFWEGAEAGSLVLPRCAECETYRWPPGPFCPHCQSQSVDWQDAGPSRIYSYTIMREPGERGEAVHVAALVEFPQAAGVRLLAAIVDADPATIRIGDPLSVDWITAANVRVAVFRPVRGGD